MVVIAAFLPFRSGGAAEFAALGDRKGLADWDDIIACVAVLQAGGTGGATLN
jgi:hypothetical protein